MESTTKRLMLALVGSWMLASSSALAREIPPETPPDRPPAPVVVPVAGPLTANSGLEVSVPTTAERELEKRSREPSRDREGAILDPETRSLPYGRGSDKASHAPSKRNSIPRPAAAAGESAEPVALPKRADARRAGDRTVPWYRSPYVALAVVLIAIAGVAKVFKRLVPGARPLASDALGVVGRIPLSAKQAAVLLHIGRRLVLVGVSADRVQALCEITDEEEVSLVLGKTGGAQRLGTDAFKKTLARQLDQYEASTSHSADTPTGAGESNDGDAPLQQTKGQLLDLLQKLRSLQSAA